MLGTDTQLRLGFVFLASSADGSAEAIMQGGKWIKSKIEPRTNTATVAPVPVPEQTKPPNSRKAPVIVSLLQATCLPAQFAKTVRAKVTTGSQSLYIESNRTPSLKCFGNLFCLV